MKEKENKELIDRMAEVLRTHSAPYREGAWEQFASRRKRVRKLTPFWYLSSAAAAILLGVVFFVNRNIVKQKPGPINNYAKVDKLDDNNRDASNSQNSGKIDEHNELNDTQRLKDNNNLMAQLPDKLNSEVKVLEFSAALHDEKKTANNDLLSAGAHEEGTIVQPSSEITNKQLSPSYKQEEKVIEKNTAKDKEEALIRMLSENRTPSNTSGSMLASHVEPPTDRRWNIGVMLAPALTEERFNMGGGVTVAYNISKKVSIGSGVSLVDLGFRQSSPNSSNDMMMDAPAPASASLSDASPMLSAKSLESKELTSFNTNLLALDIPIDIKYQVNKQFYASAGISFFAVLNEDRTNNFLTRTPTNRTIQNTEGYAFSQPEIQVSTVSEKAEETPFQGNSYSGFLNFSVGRKMPVSKKVGIAVEPFFKIPIGSLSNQNLNLRYGGVRVITSF